MYVLRHKYSSISDAIDLIGGIETESMQLTTRLGNRALTYDMKMSTENGQGHGD